MTARNDKYEKGRPSQLHPHPSRCVWAVGALLLLLACGLESSAAEVPDFESANKLYFEGRFTEAAAAYEQLLQSGQGSATLYFNLGNAWYKAGQNGRAIAAYLRAQRLAPRDPAVRFNLKFVREKVTGSDKPVRTAWQRWLASLTLNEWTLLSAGAFWVWFILLSLREAWPALRATLRNYILLAAGITVFLVVCSLLAGRAQAAATPGVVIVPEGVVRQGPLERAAVAFKLRDGIEVTVLDEQEMTDQGEKLTWLQVEDTARRVGWIKRDQVLILSSGR